MKRACVVVLGDLGRSPRMQYHTRSLIRNGFSVDLIGFAESPLVEELQTAKALQTHNLAKFPSISVPRLILAPFKGSFFFVVVVFFLLLSAALWLTITLLVALLCVAKPRFVLVQNPPSVPTLAVAWLVCRLRGCKLVVDWHNFGFSILAMSIRNAMVVALAKWFERFFGRLADLHFCVSRAMQKELEQGWGIKKVHVLHDCPPEFFGPASSAQRKELFSRDPLKSLVSSSVMTPDTLVAVSATSFTKDEKLEMLLEAVEQFDRLLEQSDRRALFVVTGKGDGRAAFEKRASQLRLTHASVVVTYFDRFSDYALMLGSADLGLSFHASSSGFDLPMKIVDMFGCGLPVCSIRYACIDELVQDGQNGLIFDDASMLAKQLKRLSSSKSDLQALRRGVKMIKWDESWKPCLKLLMFE